MAEQTEQERALLARVAAEGVALPEKADRILGAIHDQKRLAELAREGGPLVAHFERLREQV